jgi:hypothetical protein
MIEKEDLDHQIAIVVDRGVLKDEEMKVETDIQEDELHEVDLRQLDEDEGHHLDEEALVGRKDVVVRLLLNKASQVTAEKLIRKRTQRKKLPLL